MILPVYWLNKTNGVQIAHHAVDNHGENTVAWALLSMIYTEKLGSSTDGQTLSQNARFKAEELAAAVSNPNASVLERHPFLQLEILLLDLKLGSLALKVRDLAQ